MTGPKDPAHGESPHIIEMDRMQYGKDYSTLTRVPDSVAPQKIEPFSRIPEEISAQTENGTHTEPAEQLKNSQKKEHEDTMIANGWCRHQVFYLSSLLSRNAFAYVSRMKRSPRRQENHTVCLKEPWCIAYNIDMVSYRPRHVADGCDCDQVAISQDELAEIIAKEDGVPIIEMTSEDGNLVLRVRNREREPSYTAVSHVWADGLGNPRQNALPGCQLQRLYEKIDKTSQSRALFWLDTLCIPVGSDHVQSRRKSINRMDFIYRKAAKVLVLDLDISATDSTNIENCMAQIVTSVWMSRSWTYQEALLGKALIFDFADALHEVHLDARGEDLNASFLEIIMAHLFEKERFRKLLHWSITMRSNGKDKGPDTRSGPDSNDLRSADYNVVAVVLRFLKLYLKLFRKSRTDEEQASKPSPRGSVETELETYLINSFFQTQSLLHEFSDRFLCAWNSLAGRSTTKPHDKIIILATLLGFDREKLLAHLPDSQHLPTIVSNLECLPLSLLFNTAGRLDPGKHHANRWVPTTLNHEALSDHLYLRRRAKRLSLNNLIPHADRDKNVRLLAYKIDQIISRESQHIWISTDDNQTFRISLHLERNDKLNCGGFHYTCILIEERNFDTWKERRGALFYGTNRVHFQHLALFYHCPVSIEKSTTAMFDEQDSTSYTACTIPESRRISILCDPTPSIQRDEHPMRMLGWFLRFIMRHPGCFLCIIVPCVPLGFLTVSLAYLTPMALIITIPLIVVYHKKAPEIAFASIGVLSFFLMTALLYGVGGIFYLRIGLFYRRGSMSLKERLLEAL
ncbi:hypothetical protein K461DRAFT_278299 [Myriangium duriaei CBS 260.36]|uniref:Heterokaryon incompatibility domain-containing protein n=1 Tax=Myriangium duriaei CBS 260.36 TaxID=1168546 RepID=A0A9P4MN98_9PEZI|nr:hypothetical protein K461DRAFT_278299 [Myriangium duriaei CBS 260.36]